MKNSFKIRKDFERFMNESVKEEIKAKPSNVLIDKVSIKQLLDENENIASELDFAIFKIAGSNRENASHLDIEQDVKRLKYIGLNTIDEVMNALYQYKEQILNIASAWLSDNKSETLPAGLSIFYLPYAILGTKSSYDELNEYLQVMGIGNSYDRSNTVEEIIRLTKNG